MALAAFGTPVGTILTWYILLTGTLSDRYTLHVTYWLGTVLIHFAYLYSIRLDTFYQLTLHGLDTVSMKYQLTVGIYLPDEIAISSPVTVLILFDLLVPLAQFTCCVQQVEPSCWYHIPLVQIASP